jgi:hypothetical protein
MMNPSANRDDRCRENDPGDGAALTPEEKRDRNYTGEDVPDSLREGKSDAITLF